MLDVGTLPTPAFGVNGSFGLGRAWFKPRVYGVLIPPQRAAVPGSATEQVEFNLIAGGVSLCGASREDLGGGPHNPSSVHRCRLCAVAQHVPLGR